MVGGQSKVSTLIVGLGHKARNGKDTAAQAILDARADVYDIKRVAFGDALKKELNEAAVEYGGMFALYQHGISHGFLLPNGQFLKLDKWVKFESEADMTDPLCPLGKQRYLLQWWGSEYRRRHCDAFYWVRKMKEVVESINSQVVIVPDVRFMNEYLWVKANGGSTIRVEREGFTSPASIHPSEHELDRVIFDYDIRVKEGDTEELKRDAVTLFDTIMDEWAGVKVDEFTKDMVEAPIAGAV